MTRDHTAEIRRLEAAYARVDVLARKKKNKIAARLRILKSESGMA